MVPPSALVSTDLAPGGELLRQGRDLPGVEGLPPAVQARRGHVDIPAHRRHQVLAAAKEAPELAQEGLFGPRRVGDVGRQGEEREHHDELQRRVGDMEKVIALLVGDANDDHQHDQPQRPAHRLPRRGIQVTDGEGRGEDHQPQTEKARELRHDEDVQDARKGGADGDRQVHHRRRRLGRGQGHPDGARHDDEADAPRHFASGVDPHQIGQPQAGHDADGGGDAIGVGHEAGLARGGVAGLRGRPSRTL